MRAHIRELMARDTGTRRIAELAGISPQSLSRILYGVPSRNVPPAARIGLELACKILRVEANPAPRRKVLAVGTIRRLQALIARGWNQTLLAERLGYGISHFGKLLAHEQVTVATRDAVAALYDQLWDHNPQERTQQERTAATRARSMARRRRWAPPMAWDDDQIDDPCAQPFGMNWQAAG